MPSVVASQDVIPKPPTPINNKPLTSTVAKASGEIASVSRTVSSLEQQTDAGYSQLQALVRSQADEITGLHSKIDNVKFSEFKDALVE